MSKYEEMVDEIKRIINEVKPNPKDGSGSRFMGYRPSEDRIREVAKELIDEHEIVKLELDINREWINYWYRSSTPLQTSEESETKQ